jgi:hypothetical protein
MQSLIFIEELDKDGNRLNSILTKNLITNDGDIYYSKMVVGEDTSVEFPQLVLDLGGDVDSPSTVEPTILNL